MTKSRLWAFVCGAAFSFALVGCAETDAGLTTKIKSKLAADDTVKAYQIDVDTREKVVTLTGTVDNPAARTQAERLAQETEGVSRVLNQVVVNPGTAGVAVPDAAPAVNAATTAVTDAGITAAVKAQLLGDPDVAGLKIDVDTQSGVVTLSGTVTSEAQKTEAMRLARETAGVRSVNDKLRVGS